MNYFLETEVKPIQVDNGLSLHQRYQSMRYRAILFPRREKSSARPAAIDIRFGNTPNVPTQPFTDYGHPEFTVARSEAACGVNPFPSGLNEIG